MKPVRQIGKIPLIASWIWHSYSVVGSETGKLSPEMDPMTPNMPPRLLE